jgi:hypothetical protein
MAATRVLVCSKIPGLCAAVERAVAGVGERVALQHREPEDLRPGGVHHHEWQAAQVGALPPDTPDKTLDVYIVYTFGFHATMYIYAVCVECSIGKQKKSPGRALRETPRKPLLYICNVYWLTK